MYALDMIPMEYLSFRRLSFSILASDFMLDAVTFTLEYLRPYSQSPRNVVPAFLHALLHAELQHRLLKTKQIE